MAIREAN